VSGECRRIQDSAVGGFKLELGWSYAYIVEWTLQSGIDAGVAVCVTL
jgi:hypothetical protein